MILEEQMLEIILLLLVSLNIVLSIALRQWIKSLSDWLKLVSETQEHFLSIHMNQQVENQNLRNAIQMLCVLLRIPEKYKVYQQQNMKAETPSDDEAI